MHRSFFGRALVVVFLMLSTGVGIAAGIGCDLFYTEHPERFSFMKWEPSAERDRALWPSGRRPAMDASCRYGFPDGEIVKGDYEKVLAFYRQHHPFLDTLTLRSSGGDVDTAIKIGRLLRKYLVTAKAPARMSDGTTLFLPFDRGPGCTAPPCACVSACALIWFGAPMREGSVGLHRPRFTDARFGKLPPAEASVAYQQALQGVSRYLDEMEAPKTVVDAMTSTASAEVSWVDDGYGLNEVIRMHRAPSIAEWTAASCSTFTHQEFQLMLQLQGITRDRQHSAQESRRYTALFNKQEAIDRCGHRLVSSNRDRLPPP